MLGEVNECVEHVFREVVVRGCSFILWDPVRDDQLVQVGVVPVQKYNTQVGRGEEQPTALLSYRMNCCVGFPSCDMSKAAFMRGSFTCVADNNASLG